jgi:hypothetical protein
MVLKFDIEEPEERKKFIDSEADASSSEDFGCGMCILSLGAIALCAGLLYLVFWLLFVARFGVDGSNSTNTTTLLPPSILDAEFR